jgi:anti-sigma factor (TIGR02949 family)
MMDKPELSHVDCDVFCENLFLFQADELAAGSRAVMQAHLDSCEPCARRLEMEARMLLTLKRALPVEKAPEGLETRIRAALDAAGTERKSPVATFAGWWRDPKWATLAAMLLLAALIVPLVRQAGGEGSGAGASALPEIYHGMIVDHDCDRQGLSILMQRDCQDHTHLNALKLANGTYLHFNLYQSRYTRFVTDPATRGREVSIEGTVYPDIQTLEILNLQEVALSL